MRLRILLRHIHLWLGLALGGLFALLAATGSALVFQIEIDRALNPATHQESDGPAPGWNSPARDRALSTGRNQWPDPQGRWQLEVTGAGEAIPARYYPSTSHGHHGERLMVWFTPDGRRVLRAEPWGGYVMSWIYELHMHLLAGETGRQIAGWSGVAMLVLLVSGVAVWWPRGSWRKALAFKRHAVAMRRLRDIHKLAGLASAGLLLVLVGTGALLALPEVREQVVTATIAAPEPIPDPRSSVSTGQQITVAQALAAARPEAAGGRLAFIDVPGEGSAPFRIRLQMPGDPHRRFPSSYIFIDQYSGAVLAVHDVRRGTAGNAVNSWVRPLHDGSVAGLPTRILAVVIGLVPLALFVTGILHWRRRIDRRTQSQEKRSSS